MGRILQLLVPHFCTGLYELGIRIRCVSGARKCPMSASVLAGTELCECVASVQSWRSCCQWDGATAAIHAERPYFVLHMAADTLWRTETPHAAAAAAADMSRMEMFLQIKLNINRKWNDRLRIKNKR